MSDKLKKLQIKKLIQEYSYLKTDFEYKFQIIDENKQEFINKISESTEKLGINKDGVVDGGNENPIKENLNNDDVSENVKTKVKKIYREIVKLIHPDKTESNEFINLYYRATDYSEEYNLLGLFFICLDLKIDFEFDSEDIEFLEKLIELKRKECDNLTKSFVWLWSQIESEDKKNKIVELFIKDYYK